MGFLWDFFDISKGFLLWFFVFPMICPLDVHKISKGFLRDSYDM